MFDRVLNTRLHRIGDVYQLDILAYPDKIKLRNYNYNHHR